MYVYKYIDVFMNLLLSTNKLTQDIELEGRTAGVSFGIKSDTRIIAGGGTRNALNN